MQSEGVKDENEDGRRERKEWILIIAIILSSSPPLFGAHNCILFFLVFSPLAPFLPWTTLQLPSTSLSLQNSWWNNYCSLHLRCNNRTWWWWWGKKEWKWEKRNDWKNNMRLWRTAFLFFFLGSHLLWFYFILLFILFCQMSFFSAPQVTEIVIRGDHTIHTLHYHHMEHTSSLFLSKRMIFGIKKYLKIYQLQCIL